MKVLFVADVHGSDDALAWVGKSASAYDSVVVGGDLSRKPDGFADGFLARAAAGGRKVYFVHGNWDPPSLPVPAGVVALHGRTEMLGGYRVGGMGGSNPTPFNGPFEMDDDEARGVLAKLGRVDILVSHSPPAGTRCDMAGSSHIGSLPVREYVEREKPRLVLSGHVHESRAVDRLGDTTVVNPGPLRDGNYAVVHLDGGVSVELKGGGEAH